MEYVVRFWSDVEAHLRALTARQQATVLSAIEEQLRHTPAAATRNRKTMRANPLAPWELRVGVLRVYFDVSDEPERVVTIRAVGIKRGNEVWIGGRRFTL